jgi:hypothetical protein
VDTDTFGLVLVVWGQDVSGFEPELEDNFESEVGHVVQDVHVSRSDLDSLLAESRGPMRGFYYVLLVAEIAVVLDDEEASAWVVVVWEVADVVVCGLVYSEQGILDSSIWVEMAWAQVSSVTPSVVA